MYTYIYTYIITCIVLIVHLPPAMGCRLRGAPSCFEATLTNNPVSHGSDPDHGWRREAFRARHCASPRSAMPPALQPGLPLGRRRARWKSPHATRAETAAARARARVAMRRQRRRLSWLSNRAVVLGGEASGQQMGALQVRKREWNSMVGPDFYAIRERCDPPHSQRSYYARDKIPHKGN